MVLIISPQLVLRLSKAFSFEIAAPEMDSRCLVGGGGLIQTVA